MMSTACMSGEDRRLDLVQSYARHQCCPGIVVIPGRDRPEACSCPHHGMAQGPAQRRMPLRSKARLTLILALVLLIAWAYLR